MAPHKESEPEYPSGKKLALIVLASVLAMFLVALVGTHSSMHLELS